MAYIAMCGPKGYGFYLVGSKIGYSFCTLVLNYIYLFLEEAILSSLFG